MEIDLIALELLNKMVTTRKECILMQYCSHIPSVLYHRNGGRLTPYYPESAALDSFNYMDIAHLQYGPNREAVLLDWILNYKFDREDIIIYGRLYTPDKSQTITEACMDDLMAWNETEKRLYKL